MVMRAFFVVSCLLIGGDAWAARVMLNLDTSDISVGQTIGFSVLVGDADPVGIPKITPPPELAISYTGNSTTRRIVNGSVSTSVKYRFMLTGRSEGTFTLGPARVELRSGNGTVQTTSNRVSVTIKPAIDQGEITDVIRAISRFNTDEAWVGQVVLYEYTLESRLEVVSSGWFGHPWDTLIIPANGNPSRNQWVVQDEQGTTWNDKTLQPLVTTAAGVLEQPPAGVQVEVAVAGSRKRGLFGMFRETRQVPVIAKGTRLNVRRLPDEPANFSGLVGDFDVRSRFDKRTVAAGESIAWTIDLDGNGSLESFDLPPLDAEGVRVYEGTRRPRVAIRDDAFRAYLTLERTLVPTKPGQLQLPATEIVVFSPTQREYVTLKLETPPVTVTPGSGASAEVQSFYEGTSEIAEAPPDNGPRPPVASGPGLALDWTPALAVAGLLLMLPGLFEISRAGRDAAVSWRTRRAEGPAREATPLERLNRLPASPADRLAEADAAMRLALALATNRPVAELDRDAATATLDAELASVVRKVTHALDRARFADRAPEVESVVQAVREAVGQLAKTRPTPSDSEAT